MKLHHHLPIWEIKIWLALAILLISIPACTQAGPENLSDQGLPQEMPSTADMISGTTEVSDQVTLDGTEGTKSQSCLKLDSALNQVVASSNPLETARNLNLRISEEKIQVSLLLAGDDPGFLEEYGVDTGSQSGQKIQAFVPVEKLCEISNLEEVIAIRIPAEVILP